MLGQALTRPARTRLIGLAVVIVIAGATALALVKPNPFRHTEVVHAIFDRVQDLAQVQRDVRVAGVNVGTIGSVHRVGDHAEVDLLLHQRIPIYRDARAALRPHTPFEGTTFVDLDPGTAGAGPLGQAPIPLAQTSVFVSAGDVLSTFTAPVRHAFQVIVDELARALAPRAVASLSAAIHRSPRVLADAAAVTSALRGPHLTELRTLVPALARSVDALAGSDGELQRAVRDAHRTLDAVAVDDAGPLDRSLQQAPATLAGLQAASTQLVAIIDDAARTATALTPTLRAIPPAIDPLTPFLRAADPTLQALPPVAGDFAGALGSLAGSGPALSRLFAALAATGDQARDTLLPALDARTPLGLPTYLQLMSAGTALTGVMSSFLRPNQSGGQATGHALRGSIQAPISLPLPPSNLAIPCSAIAKLSAQAGTIAQDFGLCTP